MESMSYEHPSVKRPLYSFAEADRIVRVSTGTSRRWLKGYHFWYGQERREMPPVTPTRETKEAVTFVDLMEVATIGQLRNMDSATHLRARARRERYVRLTIFLPQKCGT
jgi:hypothetical protein